MIKVVGYVRVSSEEQVAKDLSIPAQIKAINRFVNDSDELRLVKMFMDEGVSAYASAGKRKGFMEMIKLAKDSDVSTILVHKLDRFSRNREESIIFKSLLKKHGVQVKSITENFDPDTPSGFLFEGIIEVINQFYSMNLSMETRKGMMENAARGYWNGGTVPYGFKLIEVPGNGDRVHKKLALGDPVEVAVLRRIFDLAVNHGLGCKAIVNHLVEENVPYRAGRIWSKQRISFFLNNHVYYGATTWNRVDAKSNAIRPESEWVIVEDAHEAIISKEQFMKRKRLAQSRIVKSFATNAYKTQWLLARMIRCGECGKGYVGIKRKRVRREGGEKSEYYLKRYVCTGHLNHGKVACEPFYIDHDYVERAVIQAIKNEITRPMRMREIERAVKSRLKELQGEQNGIEESYHARLKEINLNIGRYYNAIAEGLDPNVCKQKIGELQGQKALLEGELDEKADSLSIAKDFENDMVIIRKMARNFNQEFAQLPFDEQRMLILHFVERIEIIDHAVARVILRIPKLTPGKFLKPPMRSKPKIVKVELDLKQMDPVEQEKASPVLDQVSDTRGGLSYWGGNSSTSPPVGGCRLELLGIRD